MVAPRRRLDPEPTLDQGQMLVVLAEQQCRDSVVLEGESQFRRALLRLGRRTRPPVFVRLQATTSLVSTISPKSDHVPVATIATFAICPIISSDAST
jgi:hypothetical protein